jgi:hypothetical protein
MSPPKSYDSSHLRSLLFLGRFVLAALKPFLLEGELTVEGLKLQPGDYVTLNLSSAHQASLTKTGCLFMLRACELDEVLR